MPTLPSSGSMTLLSIAQAMYESPGSPYSLNTLGAAAGLTAPYTFPDDFYGMTFREIDGDDADMYWDGDEWGSGVALTCNLTILPDATFSISKPSWITVVEDQSGNSISVYPTFENGPTTRVDYVVVSITNYTSFSIYVRQEGSIIE